jgi:hypothetical protein
MKRPYERVVPKIARCPVRVHHFNKVCATFGIQVQYDHGPPPDLDDVFTVCPVVTAERSSPQTHRGGRGHRPGSRPEPDRTRPERPHLRRPDGSCTTGEPSLPVDRLPPRR